MSVEVETRSGWAEVTIRREESLNALDSDVINAFATLWPELDARDDVSCIILTGSGSRAFSVGADLKEGSSTVSPLEDVFGGRPRARAIHRLTDRTPVVAAIDGYCLGGGFELALACDLRIASKQAIFGLPELEVGSYPGAGGVPRLLANLPRAVALDLLLTSERLTADRAHHFGLVSRVVDCESLLPEAREIAAKIAAGPPISVRGVLRSVRLGVDRGMRDVLEAEEVLYGLVAHSEDRAEGRTAFREKRKAAFRGR